MNTKNDDMPAGETLRKFNVYVNGEHFEVMVEEIGGTPAVRSARNVSGPEGTQPVPTASETAPTGTPDPSPSKAQSRAEGVPLISPMPGTIINYEKQVGDTVQEGETVVILEAMKMENALPAPASGTILTVNFKSGDSVARGDTLCVIG